MATQPAPLPPPAAATRQLPDYLPARMVNEFVYCPRLFFYEWVEGLFQESVDTVEGKSQHKRVDRGPTAMPASDEVPEEDRIHSHSITLSSETHRVIARIDLVELAEGMATPVDYKHGKPRKKDDELELWPADRVQLAIQGLILRENGYTCEEGVVYYAATKQRVRVPFDEPLMVETVAAIHAARALAAAGQMPPPLVDSPKCPRCSMVTVCLPDETNSLRHRAAAAGLQLPLFAGAVAAAGERKPAGRVEDAKAVRPLVTPRDELRPVYFNTQGLRVGKSAEVLQAREKDKVVQEVRIGELCQVNLMGNVQLSTQAVQTLCVADVPICYFSQGSWFYGITGGLNTKNVFLRRAQYRLAEQDWFAIALARQLVAGKIRNQRTMLQRNHIEPKGETLQGLRHMAEKAERARTLQELLGIEGNGGRIYFGAFSGMIKADDEFVPGTEVAPRAASFPFDFNGRNRRPPLDPVNAMLSLAYAVLAKDFTIACYAVGFDPLMGFYHQPRFGRPALALDLMEPFRPLIADSAVLSAINTGMVGPGDFVRVGPSVNLTPSGRRGFFRAYELRMDALVTHPLFEYRVSYRRMLEIQARLLARLIEGEIPEYPVFVTR